MGQWILREVEEVAISDLQQAVDLVRYPVEAVDHLSQE